MSLPVAGTLREALLNLQNRRARLFRALALPSILIAAIGVLIWILIIDPRLETIRFVPLLSLLQLPLWGLLAVSCHRVLLDDLEPKIKLHELGDSSVNFIVRPWVKTDDYWDTYWDITKAVKIRFDQEGISIPYPQRDVHVIEHRPA